MSRAAAAQGLYGYNKATQKDCEAAMRKIQRHAAKVARAIYSKDEGVASFLALHSKRGSSVPARLLISEMKSFGPKFAASRAVSPRSLYGFSQKTATLGLNACAEIRAYVGSVVEDLHERRADQHEHITGFFKNHAKQARSDCARLVMSCYPDRMKQANVPSTVAGWLDL
jgi:hypothetical protein